MGSLLKPFHDYHMKRLFNFFYITLLPAKRYSISLIGVYEVSFSVRISSTSVTPS